MSILHTTVCLIGTDGFLKGASRSLGLGRFQGRTPRPSQHKTTQLHPRRGVVAQATRWERSLKKRLQKRKPLAMMFANYDVCFIFFVRCTRAIVKLTRWQPHRPDHRPCSQKAQTAQKRKLTSWPPSITGVGDRTTQCPKARRGQCPHEGNKLCNYTSMQKLRSNKLCNYAIRKRRKKEN